MREMEDWIFWLSMSIFVELLKIYEDFCGQYALQTASEVGSDLTFEVCGLNDICYHLCFACLGICSFAIENIRKNHLAFTRPVGFTAGKKGRRVDRAEVSMENEEREKKFSIRTKEPHYLKPIHQTEIVSHKERIETRRERRR